MTTSLAQSLLRKAALSTLALAATAAMSAAATLGGSVVVATDDDVIAKFVLNGAGMSSDLFLEGRDGAIFNNFGTPVGTEVNLGKFAVGTELLFYIVPSSPENTKYYTGPADRNPDSEFHATVDTVDGLTTVGFEDLFGGGDRDYNDLVFSFSNTFSTPVPPTPPVGPGAVPLPAAGFLLVGAMGALGLARRRKSA